MKAVISRTYGNIQTTGKMIVFDGDHKIMENYTLELPWNGNQHNSSCIPEGKYKVTKIYSPKFGKCFLLHDVPDRSAILIHKGNYNTDTRGCILVGNCFEDINQDGNLDVVGSTATLEKLLGVLSDEWTLHII